MASLYFKVGADYDKVIRLREEIKKLKSELSGMDGNTSPAVLRSMETQLAKNTKEMDALIVSAAKAGNEINQNFKKKIFDASQSVNGFTEKIIAQKAVIKDTEADVKRLGEAYRIALKRNPMSANGKLLDYTSAKKALDEEKAALFGLQQEQSKARLSVKRLRDEYALYNKDGKNVEITNKGISVSFTKILGVIGGVGILKELASEITSVTGQFQRFENVLTNALGGDNNKAKNYLGDIADFAAKTNFQLDELTDNFLKFVNRGVTPTMESMTKLGDFTNSVSKPYAQLSEAILDINNPERWKEFGVQVQTNGSKVNLTFRGMTVEADRTVESVMNAIEQFGSMDGIKGATEAIAGTIEGQMSNLKDTITSVLNEIGQSNESIISGSISMTSDLIENYDKVGRVIVGLITTYGAYRTAVMLVTAAESKHTLVEIGLTNARILARKAQLALNASMLANPYVLLATIVASFAATMWVLHDSTTAAEKAQKQLNKEQEEAARRKQELTSKTDSLISKINNETESVYSQVKAYKELIKLFPELGNMSFEEFKNMPQDQQKKIFSNINDNREIDDAVKAYEADLKRIENLKKKIQETEASPYNKSDNSWIHDVERLNKQLETTNNLAKLHKEEIDKIKQLQWEANTPVEEKVKHYEDVKKRLIEEKDELEKTLTKSEDIAFVWMSVPDIINSIKLDALNKRIDETTGKISSLTGDNVSVIQNKAYWEKRKKDAEDARDALDVSQKNSEDWNKYTREIQQAQKEISEYDITNKSDKKFEDEQKKQLEKQKSISKELLDLRLRNQQEEINQMNDGSEKKIAQINLDYDKEIAAILAKEKEWKDAQGGKLTEEQTIEIRTSLVQSYVKREKSTGLVSSEQLAEEKRMMNEYLKEYGTYLEKRQAITELYNERIRKATTEGEKLSLGEEMKKALAAVDDEAQKKTSIITKLFSDMSKRTVADIRAIADEAQEMLDYVNEGEFKTDSDGNGLFGLTKEQFDILSESPEKLQAIKDEIANVNHEADRCETTLNKMSGGLKKVFSAGDDTKKLKEGLAEIEEGMNDVMQAGQFLADTFTKLGDAFGSDLMSGIADGLNVAMDAMDSAMQGAKAGAMFGPIGSAAGAAIGVVSSLAASIAKIHDKKNEKRIERLQDQIDTLDKSYQSLDKAINKAFSNDASKLIDQQNKLLEQQKVLIQQQIREEQDKKKSDKGRIKEWQNQIDEINDAIADNKEKAKDAIFGEDMKSAIENFANAYADAWASSEDRAESAKDTVKKMMRQMVTESIKAAMESSGAMEKIRNKLKEFYSDNVLSGWEQDYIYNMAEELQKELDRQFGWADSLMKDGQKPEEEIPDNSLKGAYAKASQESIDLLAGQTGAVRVLLEDIRGSMQPIREQMRLIYDMQSKGWEDVRAIRDLTDKVEKNTEQIADNTREIKEVAGKISENTRGTVDALEGTINVKVKM